MEEQANSKDSRDILRYTEAINFLERINESIDI